MTPQDRKQVAMRELRDHDEAIKADPELDTQDSRSYRRALVTIIEYLDNQDD